MNFEINFKRFDEKMSFPTDILVYEIFPHLTVEWVVKCCRMNKRLSNYKESNEFWIHMVKRDFNILYSGRDAKVEYRKQRNYQKVIRIIGFRYETIPKMSRPELREKLKDFNLDRRKYSTTTEMTRIIEYKYLQKIAKLSGSLDRIDTKMDTARAKDIINDYYK